jgi:hypothetical protein
MHPSDGLANTAASLRRPEDAMPNRYPTTRPSFAWAAALTTLAAAWIGAVWAREAMRRLPKGTGDFEGMHLER